MSGLRLPAYGREVATLLRSGRRPIGGTIIVTTRWDFSTAFVRVVCPPDQSAGSFDFSFLRDQEVIVLVSALEFEAGQSLLARIRQSRPRRALLCVTCGDPWRTFT
jgi:hypothetical protein